MSHGRSGLGPDANHHIARIRHGFRPRDRTGRCAASQQRQPGHDSDDSARATDDRQGAPEATPEERLDRYRRDSPGLFRVCVILDLVVLFVVTGILVGALAAVLFKAIFGVV